MPFHQLIAGVGISLLSVREKLNGFLRLRPDGIHTSASFCLRSRTSGSGYLLIGIPSDLTS